MLKLFLIPAFLFTVTSFADCLPQERNPLVCPVSVVHLQALKKLRDCRGQQIGAESCIEKVKSTISNHAAFSLLGFTNTNKMSPAERNKLVRDFFSKHRKELLDEVSKQEFKARVKTPQRVPPSQVSQLLIDYRNHATRARMNPDNTAVKSAFTKFKAENREMLSLISRTFDSKKPAGSPGFYELLEKGDLRKVKVDVYKPMMMGDIDVANASWERVQALPDKITDKNGRVYDTKTLYKNQADRIVNELERQVLAGKSLNEALNSEKFKSWNYTRDQKRVLAQAVKDVAINSQIERGVELNEGRVRASRYVKSLNQGKKRRSSVGLKKIGFVSGAAVLSGAVAVAQIVIENQQTCEKAFPYTPVKYKQPFTAGLPDSHRCAMTTPKKGEKVPSKVGSWLYGNELDAVVILNSSTGGNSPCTYATLLYNAEFCTEKPTGTSGGQPASATR